MLARSLARRPCVGGEERGGEEEGGAGRTRRQKRFFAARLWQGGWGRLWRSAIPNLVTTVIVKQPTVDLDVFVCFLRVPSEALEGQRVRDEETRRTIFKDVIAL